MLKNVEKETLEEWAKECTEKYNKLLLETLQKPMLGKIGTNMQMVDELKDLNFRYENEMGDYTDDFIDDLDGGFIDNFLDAEKNGENVIDCARDCLDCLEMVKKAMSGEEYFVNDDNKICDEYGNRLSSDLEHRVFEVIPGGKQ